MSYFHYLKYSTLCNKGTEICGYFMVYWFQLDFTFNHFSKNQEVSRVVEFQTCMHAEREAEGTWWFDFFTTLFRHPFPCPGSKDSISRTCTVLTTLCSNQVTRWSQWLPSHLLKAFILCAAWDGQSLGVKSTDGKLVASTFLQQQNWEIKMSNKT